MKTPTASNPRLLRNDAATIDRFGLLPWEAPAAFQELLDELTEDHAPKGRTERHLVEELASIIWRKRRVRQAERALHLSVLHDRMTTGWSAEKIVGRASIVASSMKASRDEAIESLRGDPADDAEAIEEVTADAAMTRAAVRALDEAPDAAGYARALELLHPTTRTWWEETLEEAGSQEEPDFVADAASLSHFLKTEVSVLTLRQCIMAERRAAVREQAHGESLDPHKAHRLLDYEAKLDRKFEKTLAMLIKLQELRMASDKSERKNGAAG